MTAPLGADVPTRTQQLGLILLLAVARRRSSFWRVHDGADAPRVLAVLGPTATGKSALGLALAERLGGEIVNCDSTAVYRGFDIGTDKVPPAERRGIPHHLIDIADPTEVYTAAQFARDAARVDPRHPRARAAADPGRRHRLLLPRADRGLFPGPGRDEALRDAARRDRRAARRRAAAPDAARASIRRRRARIQPRDQKRMVRALEVYFADRPAADRALRRDACRRSPDCDVVAIALRLPADADGRARGAARRRAVRARRRGRGARAARARRAAAARARSAGWSTGR